ncbi:MAG: hypothetical protein ACJAZP_003960 [Psychromonas sp.]|jgi:hypothetical protein
MEALSVTAIWMAGVVGMMLAFGIIALVGVLRNRGNNGDD